VDLPILISPRLELRPRHIDDLEECVAMDSDPQVMKFIRWPTTPQAERQNNLRYMATDFGPGLGFWTITERADRKRFHGWVFLIPFEGVGEHGDPRGDIEIGYRLPRSSWGQGIATEAARRLVDYGFSEIELTQIGAVIDPQHRASEHVLRKVGLIANRQRQIDGLHLPYFKLDAAGYASRKGR